MELIITIPIYIPYGAIGFYACVAIALTITCAYKSASLIMRRRVDFKDFNALGFAQFTILWPIGIARIAWLVLRSPWH